MKTNQYDLQDGIYKEQVPVHPLFTPSFIQQRYLFMNLLLISSIFLHNMPILPLVYLSLLYNIYIISSM